MRPSAALAVISHAINSYAFKTNQIIIQLGLINLGTIFALLPLLLLFFVCNQFFDLYCNTFDSSSIIIFIKHAVELFSRNWMISFSSPTEILLHNGDYSFKLMLPLYWYFVELISWHLPKILWSVCQKHLCVQTELSVCAVCQVRYYSAI